MSVRARARPLAERYPDLGASVPWMPLFDGPTPVEPAVSIQPYLGRDRVWVKRDDRVSPLYGGNKVRRFEYLFAEARRRGAETLVTAGGLASTQVLATILHGRAAGFEVAATLFDQPVTSFLRRQLLEGASAGGRLARGGGYVATTVRAIAQLLRARRPYLIAPGASGPAATLGYVDAMLELGEQVARGEAPRPDVVVTATGTGGTLVGLALGAAILGWPTRFVGVRITDRVVANRVSLALLARGTRRLLARRARDFHDATLPPLRCALDHRFIGRGYGYATPESLEAIPEVERLLGVPGEVTYTGKALAALRAIGRAEPRATLLFWATLSSAALAPPRLTPAELPPAFARCFEGDVPW
jgi:D-cysteine desulfhydrase